MSFGGGFVCSAKKAFLEIMDTHLIIFDMFGQHFVKFVQYLVNMSRTKLRWTPPLGTDTYQSVTKLHLLKRPYTPSGKQKSTPYLRMILMGPYLSPD